MIFWKTGVSFKIFSIRIDDKVFNGEILIISRPKNENVVFIPTAWEEHTNGQFEIL